MKVLMVDHDFPANQLEITFFTYDEILGLKKKGVELFVVSRNKVQTASVHGVLAWGLPNSTSNSRIIRRIFQRNISSLKTRLSRKPSQLRKGSALMTGTVDLDMVTDYSKLIGSITGEHSIDIIHAQWPYPQGLAAIPTCKSQGKPLVVTTRGGDLDVAPSIGYGHRLDSKKEAAILKVLSFATKVFVPSKFMRKLAIDAGCSETQLEDLQLGVDLKMYSPQVDSKLVREAYHIGSRPIVLTMINDLSRYVKGVEYLMRAAPLILKAHPEVVFIIAGSKLTDALFRMAQDLSIQDNVLFVGSVPRMQTPFYLGATDVVVIPSIAEAMPLGGLEAMACEKPVVASNVGGIPEIVTDGETGYLVAPKDYESIAQKIITLLENPELRKRMGERAGVIARDRFDIQNQISKIHSVYEQILQSRSN